MISRRTVLRLGAMAIAGSAGAWRLGRGGSVARAATPAGDDVAPPNQPLLIVNADDFGMADAINRGIVEGHAHGIVTSTSLLVNWPGAQSAAKLADKYPELSVGLHVDLTSIQRLGNSPGYLRAVREQIERQFDAFTRLMNQPPTHMDSHHHVHMRFNVVRVFLEMSERYELPLRGVSAVNYIGGFYGQWPPGHADLARISPSALIALLERVGPGLWQLGCHPGYFASNVDDGYGREREVELRSLTDVSVRAALDHRSIRLVSYRDYPRLVAGTTYVGSRMPLDEGQR